MIIAAHSISWRHQKKRRNKPNLFFMKRIILIALLGSLAIVLFDIFSSFASLNFNIPYSLFSVGSFLIYACVGFFGAKYGNLWKAALAAGIVGFTESTVGWYISWLIGPGRFEIEISQAVFVFTIIVIVIFAVVTAALLGLIGGLLSRWF
jgi:hypothetical protein